MTKPAAKKPAAKKPVKKTTTAKKKPKAATAPQKPTATATPPAPTVPPVVVLLPVKAIKRDPLQPRNDFPAGPLQLLADDIQANGVQQPITVRVDPQAEGDDPGYILVTGERRWLASQRAGRSEIPTIIKPDPVDAPELARLLAQVKENTLRQDLNVIERAHILRRLRDDFDIKVLDLPAIAIAAGLGEISRSHVSNLIRLTELPPWAQRKIASGEWGFSHGRILLTIVDVPDLLQACEQATDKPPSELAEQKFNIGGAKLNIGYFDYEDDPEWLARTLENFIEMIAHELYPCTANAHEYAREDARIYYDPKKMAGDHGELNLRTIGDSSFILNRDLHAELNAKAREDWQQKQARKKDQESRRAAAKSKGKTGAGGSDDAPAAKPARVNDQKLREHLHAWLRATLIADLCDSNDLFHGPTQLAICQWAALGAPVARSFHDDNKEIAAYGQVVARGENVLLRGQCTDRSDGIGRPRLADFLRLMDDGIDVTCLAARNAIAHASLASILELADFAKLDLDRFRIDETFLKMLTLSGLADLIEIAGTASRADMLKVKSADARAACLTVADKIGMPPILRHLIDQERENIALEIKGELDDLAESADEDDPVSTETDADDIQKAAA